MNIQRDVILQKPGTVGAAELTGILPGAEDTAALGRALASGYPADAATVVYLHGDLGAGKTALVRAYLAALGWRGVVRSPTYTLLELYDWPGRRVCHFDLYRLAEPDELDFIGLRDYLEPESLWFVEWPERGTGVLPMADLAIALSYAGSGREVVVSAHTEAGHRLFVALQQYREPGWSPGWQSGSKT